MKRNTTEIRDFILENIYNDEKNITRAVVQQFGISRQGASQNIRALVNEGLIVASGSTRNRAYSLKPLLDIDRSVAITEKTEENQIWSQEIAPHLKDVKDNIREICHHGFTEMVNNVIDHSGSTKADIRLIKDAVSVSIAVRDYGIGIWKKIQEVFGLADSRHAILELAKGKLTTDPAKHTGEGIFFTSRMFDFFMLHADTLSYCAFQEGDEWLFDVKEDKPLQGTSVIMKIHLNSEKTARQVFDKFTSEFDDFGFTRTQLSIELAKYEGDHLVSRSQAKRIVARLQEFKEVWLDFRGITDIGQAFADEIFRIFRNEHPDVHLRWVNTNPAVKNMINRVIASPKEEQDTQPELPLT